MTTMEKPKATATRTRKAAPKSEATEKRPVKMAPKPAPKAPVAETEADLSSYASREPSDVNKAEAIWFIQNGGIEVANERELLLVQKAVQLTAGTAHRLFQGSKAAARVHGK